MAQVKEIVMVFSFIFFLQLPILVIINLIRKKAFLHNIRYIGILAYTAVIINLTLWPPILNHPPVSWSQIRFNLVPFDTIKGSLNHFYYMVWIRNILGNFILLLPLAFLMRISGLIKVVIVGFLISLSIETLQILFSKFGFIMMRSFDVDDLLLNSAGFYVGYLMKRGFMKIF